MAETTQAGGSQNPTTATVDPRIAQILSKQQAGETLTNSERGILAHHHAKLNGTFKPGAGRTKSPGASAKQAPAGKGNPLAPGASENEAPTNSPPRRPPDPALVQKTVGTILRTIDKSSTRWIVGEAVKAGADNATQMELADAAALQPDNKDLIVDSSPEALQSMGVDITTFPLWMFFGGLIAYGTGLFTAVERIRRLQELKIKAEMARRGPPAAPAAPADAKGTPIPPQPPQPPGAPPVVNNKTV